MENVNIVLPVCVNVFDITGINRVKGKGGDDALQLVSYYIICILYALCHVCCCYTSFSPCLLVCTAREITK